MMDFSCIPSPCYVIEEEKLRKNLALISRVKQEAGVEIIMAFKAFAGWKAFPIIREYISTSTASSIFEARLAVEEMGSLAHTYSPAYTERDFSGILQYSSHITFNSFLQFHRFADRVKAFSRPVSCGIRINPGYSPVETDLYNPCAPGSRLGVTLEQMPGVLPSGIEGFHCHNLCESTSFDLEKTLVAIEERFGQWLPQLKWINCGGGHLMTQRDYNVEHLVMVLKSFRSRHPHLEVILEPGSAFTWQTGFLLSTVVDVVENSGIKTAILDCSFTCHMPDCLEMPYKPTVRGTVEPNDRTHSYRLGGNSCLSGDFIDGFTFEQPLKVGDRVVFEDMIHYTMVKTNMFNGVPHPDFGILHLDGRFESYRSFGYEDYKNRLS